jgi:ATP-dependent RNA helicase RhlE
LKFEALGLTRSILDALHEQGYEAPTPIQEQAIPAALAGRDVLGCARTGTGKTCAFAAPILQRLSAAPAAGRPIRALILTPTRELAIQIQECMEAYGAHLNLKSVVIFGGVGQNPQVEAIQSGCDILVATPGRLQDLHQQGLVDVSRLEIFVLDEADRMLDMGFIHDVRKILTWLPKQKQTLFFSATMPKEISQLVDSLLHDPVKIAVDPVSSPVEVIQQSVYLVDKVNKTKLLVQLLEQRQIPAALVFTRTKHGANRVAQDLVKAGVTAAAIHGNKSQTARQAALAGFKDGSLRVLVATDIAARGLDIEDLSCVFNYNLPEVPETYVHRIGRTGRAGRDGVAISFCDYSEKPLLRDIEKLIGKAVPVVNDHPFPMQVFETPVKDARGRIVNAEDAEARAAARARKAERQKAAAQAKAGDSAEHTESAKTAKSTRARSEKTRRDKHKKELPVVAIHAEKPEQAQQPVKAARTAPEKPVKARAVKVQESAPSDIHLPGERKYKRPERKPMSALDEIAPALPEEERIEPKYGAKRTGHLRNTFFSPEEQKAYGGEAEPLMDATARLFATRKSVPGRYQEGEHAQREERKQDTGAKKAKSGKKPQPEKAKGEKAEKAVKVEKTERRSQSKQGQKAKQAANPAPQQTGHSGSAARKHKRGNKASQTGAAQERLLTPSPKKRRRNDRPPMQQRSIYGVHKKDSTEQTGSLMKPYYLSDD